MTHKNPRSFLFRLSFLITFLCIFRLAAASGFVVAWSTRAVFRSLRSPSTLCRIWLYTFANLVVPTFDCTRSCSSMAVAFSSSVDFVSDTHSLEAKKNLTHLRIADGIVFCQSIYRREDVNEELLQPDCVHVRSHTSEPTKSSQRLLGPIRL